MSFALRRKINCKKLRKREGMKISKYEQRGISLALQIMGNAVHRHGLLVRISPKTVREIKIYFFPNGNYIDYYLSLTYATNKNRILKVTLQILHLTRENIKDIQNKHRAPNNEQSQKQKGRSQFSIIFVLASQCRSHSVPLDNAVHRPRWFLSMVSWRLHRMQVRENIARRR